MNKLRRNSLLTLLAFSLGLMTTLLLLKLQSVHAQLGRVAFTVTKSSAHYGPNGEAGPTETTIFAVSSNGTQASRTQRTIPGGEVMEFGKVVDVAGRKEIAIHYTTESLATASLSTDRIKEFRTKPAQSCTGGLLGSLMVSIDSNPQPATILGYNVVKRTDELPSPPQGKLRVESWLAPQLDCYPLRKVATWMGPDGKLKSRQVDEAASVVVGEPQAGLFEIPSGFTERSPSQIFQEYARRKGQPCPECGTKAAQTLDEAYQKRAQPQP